MNDYAPIVALANAATLVAGGLVSLLAYRASRRTGSRALRAVVVGFACIGAGSVVGGFGHLFGGSVALAVAVQSASTAGGFAVLLYSLYVTAPAGPTTDVGELDV